MSAVVEAGDRRLHHELVMLASALSLAVGVIHIGASADHASEYALYAVFFALLACAQILWGIAVYLRPEPRLLLAGAVVSLGVVALWALSRAVGLPVGPEGAWRPETAGLADVLASADELLIAVLALTLVRLAAARRAPGLAALRRLAPPIAYCLLAASLVSLAASGHEHG